MMRIRPPTFAALFCLAGALCGCQTHPPPASTRYYGPTLPLDQIVAGVNQNNSRIPTLWANIPNLEAWFVDRKKGSENYVNGNGALLYSAPDSIRVTAEKDITIDLLDMGADGKVFWLYQKQNQDFIWGEFADLDKPGAEDLPIRPDLLLEVLGVRPINPDLTAEPAPVLRFNNDADSYMIVWQKRLVDRWIAQKEIWYDRTTLRPNTVLLFDANGRAVLRAWLSNYQPIHVSDVPKDQWPVIATHFRLFFPDTGSRMNFDLDELTLSHNGFPKAISFKIPNVDSLKSRGVKVSRINDQNAP